MQITKLLFAAVASMAVASTAPVLAQDPHGHDTASPSATPAAPAQCAPEMAGGMHGGGMAQMQQGMGGDHMMEMMQAMQRMHREIQQMHKEMTQMRSRMQQRRAN